MSKIKVIEEKLKNKELPLFKPGDLVKVHYKVVEAGRERVQVFQGTVLKIRGKGAKKTFTVRKISFGVGVERIFPLYSPRIAKIEVVRKGKVRRAKLYYLRERVGKATKVKEKRMLETSGVKVAEKLDEEPKEEVKEEPIKKRGILRGRFHPRSQKANSKKKTSES